MSFFTFEPYGSFPDRTEQALRSSRQRLDSSRAELTEVHQRSKVTEALIAETKRRIDRTDRLIACVRKVYSLSPEPKKLCPGCTNNG